MTSLLDSIVNLTEVDLVLRTLLNIEYRIIVNGDDTIIGFDNE